MCVCVSLSQQVRQLVKREGVPVIATCRRPAEAKELQALREELSTSSSGPLPRLSVLQLDVQDEGSIAVRGNPACPL